jgi:predicted nucleic acid-binding protein
MVYLFDEDAPAKKKVSQQILQQEGSAGNILISTQVLQEFYVTVTRKLSQPLKPGIALDATHKFALLPLVVIDAALILSAIHRSQKESFSFRDALIIDAALKGGAERLWSEDLQHGRVVSGMRIQNPFR